MPCKTGKQGLLIRGIQLLKYSTIISIITLVFLIGASICLHITLNLPVLQLLPVTAGAFFYMLHIAINKSERLFHADYIQSGEGLFTILILYMAFHFLTQNLIVISIFTLLSVITYQFIIKFIVDGRGEDAYIYGIAINTIILSSFVFMYFSDPDFDMNLIFQLCFGILPNFIHTYYFYSTLIICCIILLIITWKSRTEFSLYSHGKHYFPHMKTDYRYFAIIMTLAKSISLVLTISCIGLLGWGGYYLIRGRKALVQVFLILLLFLFLIKALEPYIDKEYILIAIGTISYILLIFHRKKRTVIYDRN